MSTISRLVALAASGCLIAACDTQAGIRMGPDCGVDWATGIDTCTQSPPPKPPPPPPPTPAPAVVRLTPEQGSVAIGDSIRFVAVPYDSLNRVFVEPSQVVWTTSDSTVLRIVTGPVHFDYKSGNSTYITALGVSRGSATLTATVIVNNGGLRQSGTASVTTY